MYEPILWYDFKNNLVNGLVSDLSNNNHTGTVTGSIVKNPTSISFTENTSAIVFDNFLFTNLTKPWSMTIQFDYTTESLEKPIIDIFSGIYTSLLNRGVININDFFYAEFAEINYDDLSNGRILTICYDGVNTFKIVNNGIKLFININDSEMNLNGVIIKPKVTISNLKNGKLYLFKLYNEYLPDHVIISEHKALINLNTKLTQKFGYIEPTAIGPEVLNLNDELKQLVDNIKTTFNDNYISRYMSHYLPNIDTKFIPTETLTYNGKVYGKSKPYLYILYDTCLFMKEDTEPRFRQSIEQLKALNIQLANILIINNGDIHYSTSANFLFTYDTRYLFVESDIALNQLLLFYNDNIHISTTMEANYIKIKTKYLIFENSKVEEISNTDSYTMSNTDNIEIDNFYYFNTTTAIFRYANPIKTQDGLNTVFKFTGRNTDKIYMIRHTYPDISNANKQFDLLNIPSIRLPNMSYFDKNGNKFNLSNDVIDKSKRELWLIQYILKSNLQLLRDYQLEDIDVKYSVMSGSKLKSASDTNGKYTFIPPIKNNKKSYVLGFNNGLYDTSIIKNRNSYIIDTKSLLPSDRYDIMTLECLDSRRIAITYDHSVGINKKLVDGKIRIFSRSIYDGIYNRTIDYPLFEIFYNDTNPDKVFLSPTYNGNEIIITSDRYFNHHKFTVNGNEDNITFGSDENLGTKLSTLLFINGVFIPHLQYDVYNPSSDNTLHRSSLTVYSYPTNDTGIYTIDLFCTPISFIPISENVTLNTNNLLYTRSSLMDLPFDINKYIIFGNGGLISEERITHVSSDIIHIDSTETQNISMLAIDYDKDIRISLLSEVIDNIWDMTIRSYTEADIMRIFNLTYKTADISPKRLYKLNKRLIDLSNVVKFIFRNMTGAFNIENNHQIDGFTYAKTAKGELYLNSELNLYEDPQIDNPII